MRKFFYIPMTLVVSACGGGEQSAPTDPQQASSTATCAETSPGDLEVSLPFAMRCYTESENEKAALIWKELEKSEGEAKWGLGQLYWRDVLGTPQPRTINGQEIVWSIWNDGSSSTSKDGNFKDYRVAKSYFEEALNMGYAPAASDLGEMYKFSKWVKEDTKKSDTHENNYNCSRYNMRSEEPLTDETCQKLNEEMIARAWGVQKDINAAIINFTIASKSKYARASLMLGEIYSFGEGVDQNIEKAIFFYRDAAVNGDANAIWNLSINYGHDTPNKDFVKSYALAMVANGTIGSGTQNPRQTIEQAMARLSISDLKRAEDMISDCIVDYDKSQPNRGNYKVNFESCDF